MIEDDIKNKAKQSICRYKVAAFGFSRKGDLIAKTTNRPRLDKYHGGHHAEMLLMKKYSTKLKTILICRVNKNGVLRPIDPCKTCAEVATILGIKINTLNRNK